jgi:hypothetical protein
MDVKNNLYARYIKIGILFNSNCALRKKWRIYRQYRVPKRLILYTFSNASHIRNIFIARKLKIRLGPRLSQQLL